MQNKKAFTLIEIIISTTILTLGVFGAYKLMGENSRLAGNINDIVTFDLLAKNTLECIKSFGNYSSSNDISFHYGENLDECLTGTYNSNMNFSGVIIDNKEFFIYGSGDTNGWNILINNHSYNTKKYFLKP